MSVIANTEAAAAETKRALLAQRLRRMASQADGAPLSFSQQRLWFLDQLQSGSALYNVASVARVSGTLDPVALERAINAVVERHEALRTRFEQSGEMPVQVVDAQVRLQLNMIDISALSHQTRQFQETEILRNEVNRPFDLSSDRLIRVTLIRQAEQAHVLSVIMHHIISDEWSLKVFFSELATAYEGFKNGTPPSFSQLPIQYSDFAAWQRKWMRGEILEKQLTFWKKTLAGELPVTELPSDRPRRAVPEFKGGSVTRLAGGETLARLKALAEQEKATLFMVLMTGLKCLVSRYTGNNDIIVGSPIAGRNRVEAEGLIGFFVNTLPLRTSLEGDPSFRDALRRVRRTTLDAYSHQDLPFDRLVEEVRPERSLTHMPFTSVMFSFQSDVLEHLEFGGLRLDFIDVESETSKFEFTLVAQDTPRGLVLKAEYDVALFNRGTIERCLEHLENLLCAAARNPDATLSSLPLLGENELQLILEGWSQSEPMPVTSKCIHEVFEERAAHLPGALALQFGDRRMTYGELNIRANQVAHYLRGLGIGPDRPVAICTRSSPELIVGILGILKAGGAYVPLDSNYPKDRMEFMLQDTQASVVLTEQGLMSELPKSTARTLCLDSDWEVLACESRQNPANLCTPGNLAYIMYTSGSTGIPKGVCVPHRAVNRLVLNTNYIQICPNDRIAQVSNVSFDAATFEIWGALLNGAPLIRIGKDVALSPAEFGQELKAQNITALFLTTALFNQLANDTPGVFASVATVMFGGEACDAKAVRKVFEQSPPRRLLHVYGPTENTTFSTWHLVERVEKAAGTVPIGRPISNTQIYVLDLKMNPVPAGVPGELYVAGTGLARGYWRREELTEKFFMPAPAFVKTPGPIYKTGDLVKWNAEGQIEFLGRIDNQVKIRGFRVELGEIESVLAQHTLVRDCAVTLRGAGAGRRLVAYIVPQNGAQLNASEIRVFLKQKLPDYMVPGAFVMLESFPLTPNGKVNRKALPAPDQARPELEHVYVAPRDETERKLTAIYEAVLGVHPVGVQDKFFDLGGHSLMAIRLVSKIEKEFGRKLRLATIFQAPMIEQLASVLRGDVRESSLTSTTSLVEIQTKGSKPPLFLVHGAGGGMFWGYVNLSKYLGPDQPVYGFRSRGLDGAEEFETIEELAAQYVEDLQKFQPQGPYHLGGYCFGGNVAYEMARQLEESGEKVALLAVINGSPANSKYQKAPWTPLWAARFAKNLVYWGHYCMSWSTTQRREFVAWKVGVLKRRLGALNMRNGNGSGSIDPGNMVDLSSYTDDQKKVWEAHIRALLKYHPKPYGGVVHLLRSGGHPLWCSFEPDYGWGEVAANVDIITVSGAHEKVLEEPCVEEVAKRLSAIISDFEQLAARRFPMEAAAMSAAVAGVGWLGAEFAETFSQGVSVLEAMAPAALLPAGAAVKERSSLSDEDEQRLKRWNNTRQSFDLSRSYMAHFAERVRQSPNAPAVRQTDKLLTYRELDERANKIAGRLAACGVGPGSLVAVSLARSLDLIATLLAIWKNGAAYLPLDTNYPQERLTYMLEDSKAAVLVTQRAFTGVFPVRKEECRLVLDDPEENRKIEMLPAAFKDSDFGGDTLAYVIYTSGSTGKPKGVEVLHASLLNHNFAVMQAYSLTPADRVVQFSPVSFDISIEEIFPTLLAGAELVLRPEEVISSVRTFLDYVSREGVTVLDLPTAYWHEIVERLDKTALPECVRLVVIGGEKASDEAFRRWKKHVDARRVLLVNTYGPTETTVSASYYSSGPDDESLPIGKPLANVQFAVLDSDLERVAVGQTGELFIGGSGLARGYLNRPDVTAERFVPNPFKDIKSTRLYRTGDLVRFREDGCLEFIGRTDNQVKIRGFRIELGEIESTLLAHPNVRDTVVLAREDKPGQKKLVAYVVPRNGESPHVTYLLDFVRKQMPAYMVPSAFVVMESFPMTPGGKVDRRALPAPGRHRPELDHAYTPPRTPLESVVASVYQEVLEFDQIGVLDNFFDLGGHSLAATQVIARLRQLFRVEVPLSTVFGSPTIAEVSEQIEKLAGGSLVVPLSAVNGSRRLELSPAQARIWFLDQFDPRQSPYNLPIGIRLSGPLDQAALDWGLSMLSNRHEALRCVFPAEQGVPVQYICAPSPVAARLIDLTDLPPEKREQELNEVCARESRKNSITYRPVLNPFLIRLSDREHVLLLVVHRIAVDLASVRILLKELVELYDAKVSNREPDLPEPASYEETLREMTEREAGQNPELERYWTDALKGAPELLELPSDRQRSASSGDQGARFLFRLPQKLTHLLGTRSSQGEQVLLAAFVTLLHRYSGSRDIVTAITREACDRNVEPSAVGPFEDYLPLRHDLSSELSFEETVRIVGQTLASARERSDLPFSRMIELLKPARHSSYTPIFQVVFGIDHEAEMSSCPGGVSFMPFEIDNKAAMFDLDVRVRRREREYWLSMQYSTALFDTDRIERMANHFAVLLTAALENPGEPVSRLPLMTDQELERVVGEWNRTQRPYATQKTLIGLFDEQARRTPDATALVSGHQRLSYHQLSELSARLAARLRALGVGTEGKVALCMERSKELLAAMLGTFRTGAAYVPVDPTYPRDRIEFMLKDSGSAVILTERKLADTLPKDLGTVLCVEDIDLTGPVPDLRGLQGPKAGDLAYVIYTSGSTGVPEGVMIEHRNAVAFVHWAKDSFDTEELSGVLAATSICFDLSIFELFAPLCWGGKVILANSALDLPSLPAAKEVRLINTVPSAMRELLRIEGVPDNVRTVNFAREPLATSLVSDIYSSTKVSRVLDLYGPTETTTYSTWATRRADEPATIGKPLSNQQIYLLDENLQPVPVGVPGEVHIGGAGVARGYLNRQELTAERFIQNPFMHNERVYKTGDLARWRREGNLEYLGRKGHQVKTQKKPPAPEAGSDVTPTLVGPRTETEARLLDVWKAVLPVKRFGVSDDFFDLGGHSLLAIQIVAKVRDAFGIDLPLFTLFDTPTIEDLAQQIDSGQWASGGQQLSVVRRVARDKSIPASFVQERLWFLDQLNPGSDAYNVPVALRLKGKLDLNRLEAAYHNVIRRHETLRTTFAFEDTALVQRIAPELKLAIELVNLSTAAAEIRESRLAELLAQASSQPFDLANGPLVRAHLFKLGEEEHVLLFSMHHTISDGWSLALMFKELEAFYTVAAGTVSTPSQTSTPVGTLSTASPSSTELDDRAGVPSLPVQYADYAVWQREALDGSALEAELTYWRDSMRGAPAQIEFPTALGSDAVSDKVEKVKAEFPNAFVKALARRAQETGATPFAILMSALAITLSKWTGQQDLVIGTVVAGRSRRELEPLIGCFMNFLPIRTLVNPEDSVEKFLKDMRNRVLEAQSHQDCPFEKIVEALNPARKGDSNPLYNVALLWQNFPHDLFQGEALETELVPVAPTSALLDLRIEAEQLGDAISIICEYRHGKFDSSTIEKLLESLRSTMEALVAGSAGRIADIQIDGALTTSRHPEALAKKDNLALSGTFTIEPLKDSLQHWVRELGLNMELEFAPYNQVFQELLNPASILGSNQAGANVTLIRFEDWIRDKAGPESATKADIQRNLGEFVRALKELATKNPTPHIVCTCPPSSRLQGTSAQAFIEHSEDVLAREIESLPGVHLLPFKQVFEWYPVADYNDSASDELGHVPFTPLFFTALGTAIARKVHAIKRNPVKVIVLDCDHTLWSGVCGEDGAKGILVDGPWKEFQEFMRRQRESGMLLALCSKNNLEDVEEVFSKRHEMPLRRDHFAAVRLNWLPKSENLQSIAAELNLGLDSFVFIDDNPVECAEVEARCPEVLTLQLPEDPTAIPGFVRHCWVFDRAKLTAEDKKRAEMYRQNSERERLRTQSSSLADFIASLDLRVAIEKMSGAEVSRVAQLTQRTNQFNMTARRRSEAEVQKLQPGAEVLSVHVSDRFGDYGLVGVVIYRASGESLDVDTFLLSCRVLGRGVEHRMLGRLGEIAREHKLNWVDLHYTPTAKNRPALNFLESTAGSFKQHVGGGLLFRLPAGFASEVTFNIQSMPVETQPAADATPKGPAPRETFRACRSIALNTRDIAQVHKRIELGPATGARQRDSAAVPETKLERQLAEIWSNLLKRQDIGVNDNFFDLGGHSLLAVRLFAEIGRVTGKKLPLVTLFQAPTIRELARILQRDKERKPAGPEALLVPIQPGGDLPPLFLVHGAGGDVLWGYANLAAHMGADRPIYGIKSRGQVGLEECKTITEMARAYVEAIRTRQSHGPYYLGGYCFGGNVAYEMARLLRAQGEQVAIIALLDSSPSNAGYEDTAWTSPKFAWRFSRNAFYWLQDFVRQPLKVQVQFVARKWRVMGRKLRDRFAGKSSTKVDLEEVIDLNHFPEHELKLWQTHIQALVEHTDQPYDGSVILFRTRGQPVFCSFEDDFCWRKLARQGARIVRIPGAHENIFMEPNVEMLARALSRALAGEENAPCRTSPGEPVSV